MHGFVMYDAANDEMVDVTDAAITHESCEDTIVDFEELPNGRSIRIMFNLDAVSVHQQADGDVIVTVKNL